MPGETKRSVNTKARQVIEKVREVFGYTFEEIADLCGVSTGSVQRWYSSGRARADKIIHIENLLSNIRLSESKIAENLIEIYRDKKHRYCLTYSQFRNASGRDRLSPATIQKIQTELDDRGFILLEEVDSENRTVFIVLRRKWCLKTALQLNEDDLKDYYRRKVEKEIEEVGD